MTHSDFCNPSILNVMQLETTVFRKFTAAGRTLSVAESCTGGLICERLTNVPGASSYFLMGIVAYDNLTKVKVLKVPGHLLKRHGSVSAEVACAMARRVRLMIKADCGLSVTGIAGPGGGSRQKPVGLVFLALSVKGRTTVKKCIFQGSRLAIRRRAAETALKMLAQRFE